MIIVWNLESIEDVKQMRKALLSTTHKSVHILEYEVWQQVDTFIKTLKATPAANDEHYA